MRKILGILFFISTTFSSFAQVNNLVEGVVTFVNPAHIYVRFEQTKDLSVNDTLIVFINNRWEKILLIEAVSSKSCVTKPLTNQTIQVGFKVGYYRKNFEKVEPRESVTKIKHDSINPKKTEIIAVNEEPNPRKQTINGRLMVSANGSMEAQEKNYSRLRTSLVLDVNNINGSKFSIQNYINYQHRLANTSLTQTSFRDDFKVYTLAINYEANPKTNISLGRKINDRMANMGAIDGLQVQHQYKKIIFGGFTGFNPDYNDYSFNSSLFQLGGFIAHEIEKPNGLVQTSLAFAEQKNNFKTDRRFLYFQHSNALIKNMYLFYSLELDLFQNINGVKSNDVNLTSTYISLRYRPFKKLNISTSYDNRRNVIYYESYRTFIDQLINQETRQGFRVQVNHSISKYLSLNVAGFYRYQSSKPEPTKNYVVNLNLSQVLGNGSFLNLNINTMNTYYFDGKIIGGRLSKDLFKSKLSAELSFRRVDYNFFNTEQQAMEQNIIGISTSIYTAKRTSIMLNYEGTFESTKSYNRYFITISQRFKSKNK
ncbi:hypothetical protein Emtol_0160 (plasmid) [Emticicia oligotrophica DSM 17448]|uniref:Uncharacterized protein n=1 Tax=Emticicia oligotrophica (strain DSM 17448 / CIP 109782 / MTCC 6937 / GPTSA100-15) TaxID=929562 RepID=A0ABM5N806_EMTOG|nr:hypothetical protein [Emticicia oligotrophica]AFK05675.1 hypothetical protein Emtol_0160 [Emticicia oligotrophica DSM 17448]